MCYAKNRIKTIDHVFRIVQQIQSTIFTFTDAEAMEHFMDCFRTVTELTLCKSFIPLSDTIVISLNRIIPLKQLTKLSLDSRRLPIDQVVELLYSTPNVLYTETRTFFTLSK